MRTNKTPKIVVTGHPYVYPHYFAVFEHVAEPDQYVFILPRLWRARVTIEQGAHPLFSIYKSATWSYGKKSILGSFFKGWQPGVLYLLPYLRLRHGSKVLYSCSEPNLFVTLYNVLIARIVGMKVVLFTWQNIAPERRIHGYKLYLSNLLVQINTRLSSGIICGNHAAERLIKRSGDKIQTIVCPLSGVDTDRFNPNTDSSVWCKKLALEGKRTLLFYGALDERKGLDVLLRAFGASRSPEDVLVIVGRGSLKDQLVSLAHELSIADSVVFIDWVKNSELPSLLAVADVFVYPSVPYKGWEEQFGYSIAEASSSSKVVISTTSGSISSIVIDGETGLLVPPGQVQPLAQAMQILLENPSQRETMGKAGRQFIVAHYRHAVVADKLGKFLKSFL